MSQCFVKSDLTVSKRQNDICIKLSPLILLLGLKPGKCLFGKRTCQRSAGFAVYNRLSFITKEGACHPMDNVEIAGTQTSLASSASAWQ